MSVPQHACIGPSRSSEAVGDCSSFARADNPDEVKVDTGISVVDTCKAMLALRATRGEQSQDPVEYLQKGEGNLRILVERGGGGASENPCRPSLSSLRRAIKRFKQRDAGVK